MAVAHVELTDDELRALQEIAAKEARTVADLLRSRVEPLLQGHEEDRGEAQVDREELKRRALALSGRFRSGLNDLSAEHDRYLEEAFGER